MLLSASIIHAYVAMMPTLIADAAADTARRRLDV